MAEVADRRAGFHSVTPRMVVGDLEGAVSFLRTVFGAGGEVHAGRPAEIRIGDSVVMITKAGERELFGEPPVGDDGLGAFVPRSVVTPRVRGPWHSRGGKG
jgi:hypothetical protein